MNARDWLDLADRNCLVVSNQIAKANEKSAYIDRLIIKISEQVSDQWMSTHDNTIQQVENGLKTQGKLITTQYDVIQINFNILKFNLNHFFYS